MISLRNNLAVGFFLLVASQLSFSTTVAEGYQHIGIDHCGSSPSAFGGEWYRDQCTVGDVDCSTVTCNLDFMNSMKMKVNYKINNCDDPVSLTVTIDVTELNIAWSHTYAEYEEVEVPGFTGVTSPPVHVTVGAGLTQNSISITAADIKEGRQRLTIRIYAKSARGSRVMSAKIETVLPVNTKDCGAAFVYWFKRQPDGVKAAVIISPILFLSLVVIGLCYCRKRRRAPSAVTMNIPPPSYEEATTIHSKVPMQPLVNE